MTTTVASVRYIVDDVDAAVAFYRDRLGFEVAMHPAPGFAALDRAGLRLLLNAPGAGSAGKAGEGRPRPGGWNRFQIVADDLDGTLAELAADGIEVWGKVTEGAGGRQALVRDPSGNPVELFEPARSTPGEGGGR